MGDKAGEPNRWASLRSRLAGQHKRDLHSWARAGRTEWEPDPQRNGTAYPVGFLALLASYPKAITEAQQVKEAASAYWRLMKGRSEAQQVNTTGLLIRDAIALRIAANYRLEQDAPGRVPPILADHFTRGHLPNMAEWLTGDLVNLPAQQVLGMIPSNDQGRELAEAERITAELLAIEGMHAMPAAA